MSLFLPRFTSSPLRFVVRYGNRPNKLRLTNRLKCNRAQPCENCVKRGDAYSCTYAQAASRKKSATHQNNASTSDDMQNRIDRLEGLVLSLMTNGASPSGPPAAMAALSGSGNTDSTQNSGELGMAEDAPTGPDDSDTEQVTKSFGILKVDNTNKSYYISEAHWASVLSDVSQLIGLQCVLSAVAFLF